MSDIGQADPYQYAAECEKTAALNQRENVRLKTELAKLQAKLDKEIAQHAETKRQLTELDARYTPLVTENDALRQTIEEKDSESEARVLRERIDVMKTALECALPHCSNTSVEQDIMEALRGS